MTSLYDLQYIYKYIEIQDDVCSTVTSLCDLHYNIYIDIQNDVCSIVTSLYDLHYIYIYIYIYTRYCMQNRPEVIVHNYSTKILCTVYSITLQYTTQYFANAHIEIRKHTHTRIYTHTHSHVHPLTLARTHTHIRDSTLAHHSPGEMEGSWRRIKSSTPVTCADVSR